MITERYITKIWPFSTKVSWWIRRKI